MVTPEKGSNPRILKISDKRAIMLKTSPRDFPKSFNGSLGHFARPFCRQRKRTANKLKNKGDHEGHFSHAKTLEDYHGNSIELKTFYTSSSCLDTKASKAP